MQVKYLTFQNERVMCRRHLIKIDIMRSVKIAQTLLYLAAANNSDLLKMMIYVMSKLKSCAQPTARCIFLVDILDFLVLCIFIHILIFNQLNGNYANHCL